MQNAGMKNANPAGPYKASLWTLLFLTAAMFLLFVFSQSRHYMPSEEMQIREAQQRAFDRLNHSN
jgi:hypothetical protein